MRQGLNRKILSKSLEENDRKIEIWNDIFTVERSVSQSTYLNLQKCKTFSILQDFLFVRYNENHTETSYVANLLKANNFVV